MSTMASQPRTPRVRLRPLLAIGLIPVGLGFAANAWLTAPIEDRGGPVTPALAEPEPGPRADAGACESVPALAWPAGPIEGEPAKRFLLAAMESAERTLDEARGYTATLVRRERLKGTLGPEQTLAVKVRHRPFSIYLKFLSPKLGKEVLYVDGHRQNKVLAHNGDWTRRIVPRMEVEPTSALAMNDNRHPVTEAGLLNLTRKLLHFRHMDMEDEDAKTSLARDQDDQGRERLRSFHEHAIAAAGKRPFHYVEVEYDPETFIPVRVDCYDWPAPGEPARERKLAESYHYRDILLNANLSDLDFDPTNPAYEFTRY